MAPPAGRDAAGQGPQEVIVWGCCPLVAAASGKPKEWTVFFQEQPKASPEPFPLSCPQNASGTCPCQKPVIIGIFIFPTFFLLPFWWFIWGTLVLTLCGLGGAINQDAWSWLPIPAPRVGR